MSWTTWRILVPAVDGTYVLRQKLVLGAARLELARGVDEEYFLTVVLWFGLTEHENAGGETGAVEQVRPESDHGFEEVHLEEVLPDLAFLRHSK
jgi:hypothetical protein